jgi:hypothetical protein
VDEPQRTAIVPPFGAVSLTWTVKAPPAGVLANTNTLYLQVEPSERPIPPAAPIVLIGARRLRYAGPYPFDGASMEALSAQSLPPESGDGQAPHGRPGAWSEAFALDNALPLQDLLAGGGAIYVQTFLWSPDERPASLGVPANCPRKMWLNGVLVVESATCRPARPNYNGDGQSYAPVTLRQGWNEILLKFVRDPGADPFEGHLIHTTPDDLRAGLVDVRCTRLPWDV